MTIRITCPGCKTSLTLEDEMRGRKVRCRKCEKVLNIPEASEANREKAAAVQNGQKIKVKAKTAPARAEENEEEETPRRTKKKKQQSGPGMQTALVIGGAAVFVLLIASVVMWAVFMKRKEPEPAMPILVAKAEEPQKERSGTRIIIPSREEGNPPADIADAWRK